MDCSDEGLFAQVQQGDQEAFRTLVERYQDRVYSLALRIVRQPQDAQEAAQQAFLQAWHKRQSFNERWRFRPWLYRLVANLCIDEYRRQQRHRAALPQQRQAHEGPETPEQAYGRTEWRQRLEEALTAVPIEARMVLVLCYIDGLSYGDIARIRGITVATVKSQLRRAKMILRERLGSAYEV
ncbi:MAG: RNA polymerase sigma factor [Candidatus Tectimicrobiota bacterium]